MTFSLGLLLLIAGYVCYRAKGAQLPYMILGALIIKAAGAGSMIDNLAATGLDVVQTFVTTMGEAVGQSGIV